MDSNQDSNTGLLGSPSNTQFLSGMPLLSSHGGNSGVISRDELSFPGYHSFAAYVPLTAPQKQATNPKGSCRYYVVSSDDRTFSGSTVFVPKDRFWAIKYSFMPSVTPLNYFFLITPCFVVPERRNDSVKRCLKHTSSPRDGDVRNQSFIEVDTQHAVYETVSSMQGCPPDQISVLIKLDVITLYRSTSEKSSDKHHTVSLPSNLLPPVYGTIICRAMCFNSCLGTNARGEIELLLTLERRDFTENSPLTVAGMQRIRLRCCACPHRDAYPHLSGGGDLRRSPKLSLGIVPKRNLRQSYGPSSSSSSSPFHVECPTPDSSKTHDSVTINGRKVYIIMTEDLNIASHFTNLRTVMEFSRITSGNPASTDSSALLSFCERKKRYYERMQRQLVRKLGDRIDLSDGSQSDDNKENSSDKEAHENGRVLRSGEKRESL